MAYNDGKLTATVTRAEDYYAIATDAYGVTYFLYSRYFDHTGAYDFEDVRIGTVVKFIPTEGPRGFRGVDVEIVSI